MSWINVFLENHASFYDTSKSARFLTPAHKTLPIWASVNVADQIIPA